MLKYTVFLTTSICHALCFEEAARNKHKHDHNPSQILVLRKIVAFTRPAQASAAIFSDPFRIPTPPPPPNSTCWDEVDLNHNRTKPSHPLDTCSIVPTPPLSQWQESAEKIGGDAPALKAAGNTLTLELFSRIECTL